MKDINHINTQCIENVYESIIIELKSNNKCLTFGRIYRHSSEQKQFLEKFLDPTLEKISKEKILGVLAGDFNCESLSTHAFQPLILHPLRVTVVRLEV